jgi:hypothetical protein
VARENERARIRATSIPIPRTCPRVLSFLVVVLCSCSCCPFPLPRLGNSLSFGPAASSERLMSTACRRTARRRRRGNCRELVGRHNGLQTPLERSRGGYRVLDILSYRIDVRLAGRQISDRTSPSPTILLVRQLWGGVAWSGTTSRRSRLHCHSPP